MTAKEYLKQYERAVNRARRYREEYERESELIDAVRSLSDNDGMPHGTNDPESAILQRRDTDEVLDKIELKCQELREMVDAFELILDGITDRRLRIIIRNYYALGWTDERIGEQLELSRQHVNRLRTAYVEVL